VAGLDLPVRNAEVGTIHVSAGVNQSSRYGFMLVKGVQTVPASLPEISSRRLYLLLITPPQHVCAGRKSQHAPSAVISRGDSGAR
jgi:hypothetical protein